MRLAGERYAGQKALVLSFDPAAGQEPLPDGWQRLRISDILDSDAARQDFLAFLEAWPRKPLWRGKCFDELFLQAGGYSLWWTGPGSDRHTTVGAAVKLKALWVCDRVLRQSAPCRVVVCTREGDMATAIASRCRKAQIECDFLPMSAQPQADPSAGRLWWLAGSVLWLILFPCLACLRAVLARVFARTPPISQQYRQHPAVVIACSLSSGFAIEGGQVRQDFWRELCQALSTTAPRLRHCFLVTIEGTFQGYRPLGILYHSGWRLLRRFEGAIPIADRYVGCTAWLKTIPKQLAALLRYWRVEKTTAFRESFSFAGADVSAIYIPSLRRAVARSPAWVRSVEAITESLLAAGNVKVVLVSNEFYPFGMPHIAAARRLGIPTVGVQHGTVFPNHWAYTPPRGFLDRAPSPDYFAAYGPYAREIVSRCGTYPAERVWITGSPRFDRLVNHPLDMNEARRRLDLPKDKRIVLLTTQTYPWFRQVTRALFLAAKDREDWLVCVKRHPVNDSLEVYQRIAGELRTTNVRFFDGDLEPLIAACDVLISGSSTTVFQAVLMGRRTVCVNFSQESDWYPYVADGGAIGARSEQELQAAVSKALDGGADEQWQADRLRFLARHAGASSEGQSAATFAGLLAGFCNNG